MHTARNRLASRPHNTSHALAENKPPIPLTARQDRLRFAPATALTGAPWALAVPAPAEERPKKRRNPKGKKARKAAARKAAAKADNSAVSPQTAIGHRSKQRGAGPASPAHPLAPAVHPKFENPLPKVAADAPIEFDPALARVLTLASMPELLVLAAEPEVKVVAQAELDLAAAVAPALALPAMPEPLVELPASLIEPLRAPAMAALADAQAAPLPRARALVPARQQGLVDVIAFLLRDSGRRLARWSARRQKSKAERELLRSAEARQRALLSELEALDALRLNRGPNRGQNRR